MILSERSILRKNMRQKRLQLNATYKEKADAAIVKQLSRHPLLESSYKIAGYFATDGEVDVASWFKNAWSQNKQCYLPKVVNDQLLFAKYDENTQLIPNQWNILEPKTNAFILPSMLDAVIVPLVTFDAKGNRLGRGAGYYDRSFSFLKDEKTLKKPYLIGVGYTFQKTTEITITGWDVPLHHVITESFSL